LAVKRSRVKQKTHGAVSRGFLLKFIRFNKRQRHRLLRRLLPLQLVEYSL